MDHIRTGLYEQIIGVELSRELDKIPEPCKQIEKLDAAEAPQSLSEYVAEATRRALEATQGDLQAQVTLVNRIMDVLGDAREDLRGRALGESAEKLMQITSRGILGQTEARRPRPETPMSVSSLFTGALHEPAMYAELQKEICSADRIDLLVSFVKWSGLRLLMGQLQEFAARGGKLRVITTSYMGATQVRAVQELAGLPGAQVRISYDVTRTRLHAKTYVFHRDTGLTTAYVGSSNLSGAAMSSGLEWNLKITAADQPDTLRKIRATFDAYWNSEEFEDYTPDCVNRLAEALRGERWKGERQEFIFDIRPYPYQQAILDRLRAEREVHGSYRNLVVAATGTGKTVIAALDYRRWIREHPREPNRLLFIAHREEILRQSLLTFRGVLRDANFGDLWVGGTEPALTDHLFISVQTLNSQKLWEQLPSEYYGFIVVDETHHIAADSYRRALGHFSPRVLLGMTATPERMDGKDILKDFNGRIAAEIRLPEAIERRLLSPFQYFGVSDTIDLDEIRWTRGGYDRAELNRVYTLSREKSKQRAEHVLIQLNRYCADMEDVKAIGFCVSIEHARFMAEVFCSEGVPAMSLDSQSSPADRQCAKQRLLSGEIHVIFVVDLYNEGVDIPEINTVLFLRPTESLTIFLQQLGRGMRLCEGKECLTVLDFIGAANRRYSFGEKLGALLGEGHRSLQEEIERGFSGVPRGCCVQLERRAAEIVLENIRQATRGKGELIRKIQYFVQESGQELSLGAFLDWAHLTPGDIYGKKVTFSRLCMEAKVLPEASEPAEEMLQRVMKRFCAVDSRRWLSFMMELLELPGNLDELVRTESQRRMLGMMTMTLFDEAVEDPETARERMQPLLQSPHLCRELLEMLRVQFDRIDFTDEGVSPGFDCPMDVYCTYTQRQLLAGLGYRNVGAMRQGVLYLPEKKTDVFLITLNKSDRDYSPTTMYEDYAISAQYFHWQSQSTTSEASETGQRYIHHAARGNHILLFVREFKRDALGAAPYTFLGEADYVSHTGSRPMNIVWKLRNAIPAKYLTRVRQAM